LGAWLRESREAAGLTQEELAERSGLAVRTIGNLERGVSARPYPGSVRMLVRALGLPPGLADEVIVRHRAGGVPASRRPSADRSEADGHLGDGGASAPGQLLSVPRQLPAAPRHFVGRRPELESLAGLQGEDGGGVVTAISGMGGVGKTALALHWAHRVADRFPDGQLYVDLGGFGPSGTPVNPAVALRDFLTALGVAAAQIPEGLDARAGLYRSLVAGRRMIIVLDNARDAEQARPLLPSSPGCLALVTSRARLAGLAVAGNAGLVALDVLSQEEARQLLVIRLGAGRVAAEPDAAGELIGLCARLPLAVAIAAARAVAYPQLPLSSLAAELRDASRRLDGLDAEDAATSIRTVLSWSYQQLADPPARMLRLLALHPGPGITAAAAASMAAIPPAQAQRTLRALAAANLITEYLPGRYGLHDLLRAFAAEQAQAAGDHRAATRRMLDHYLHTADSADVMISLPTVWQHEPVVLPAPQHGVTPESFPAREQALAWFDAEHAVLVRVTGQAARTGFDAHAWQLARSLGVFLRLRGHWHDLIATQRIALATARRQGDQSAQARVHCELGYELGQGGRFRQAYAHLRRALRLSRQLGDHEFQERTHIALGMVLSSQGRDREALAVTLAVLRPPSADSHSADTEITRVQAIVLNNLGWFHARLGELDQARAHCERALQLYRDLGSHYGQAITLDSLAYICRQADDHAQAAARYRHAADQLLQIGALHKAAEVLIHLGDTYQAAADPASARDAWQQAIRILDGMQHPAAAEALAKLRQLHATNSQPG
jgi:tetratricopeptide (TPR) repeat protein/transcriptional regulator with XRE-family HTH domain